MDGMPRRLSPALLVSIVALVAALGGTSYAAGLITGKSVKDGSLTGRDVRKNSLTGTQIRESKVGKVPRAKVADKVGNKTAAGVTTRAFFAAQKAPKGFTGDDTLIGKITLPAGAFIITAKTTVTNTATGTLRVSCFLRAGTSEDRGTVALPPGNTANTAVIPLLQAHFQNSSYEAGVYCKAEGNAGLNLFHQPPCTTAPNTKIAAIRADDAQVLDF